MGKVGALLASEQFELGAVFGQHHVAKFVAGLAGDLGVVVVEGFDPGEFFGGQFAVALLQRLCFAGVGLGIDAGQESLEEAFPFVDEGPVSFEAPGLVGEVGLRVWLPKGAGGKAGFEFAEPAGELGFDSGFDERANHVRRKAAGAEAGDKLAVVGRVEGGPSARGGAGGKCGGGAGSGERRAERRRDGRRRGERGGVTPPKENEDERGVGGKGAYEEQRGKLHRGARGGAFSSFAAGQADGGHRTWGD